MTNPSATVQDDAFHDLLSAWNRHHELRTSGAPLDQLWSSRLQLDDLRLQLRH